jgi:kinesin family protein 15
MQGIMEFYVLIFKLLNIIKNMVILRKHLNISKKPMQKESNTSVKVVVRVRPLNEEEQKQGSALVVDHFGKYVKTQEDDKVYTFDYVANDKVTQIEIFQQVGLPIVESCMSGYNGTIFCYGQTGSGKTYTMIGRSGEDKGLIPLILESLFSSVGKTQRDDFQVDCVCSFLEIYNEKITDLLDFNKNKPDTLCIREGMKEGVYVEGIIEQQVKSSDDALSCLKKGLTNRHVGSTQMNDESSRSHSVFTVVIKQTQKDSQGISKIRTSKLNLIDLAGSERQKSTKSEGDRLNEACYINKSLTCLGQVINSLVDIANGKERHVNYRDSKLTFLLRDSLGGNSQTCIIANASPALICSRETISTLKFAQRAKFIKNKPIVNEDSSVAALKEEIKTLKQELESFKKKTYVEVDEGVIDTNSIVESTDGLRKYQIIQKTLSQLAESENQVETCLKKIDLLTSLDQSKTEFVNQMRMMLKLRECQIAKLTGVEPKLDFREQEEVLNEIERVLKEMFHPDLHPSALKFAVENIALKEQLMGLERSDDQEKKEIKEYNVNLRAEMDQLIELVAKNGYKRELEEAMNKIKTFEKSEAAWKNKIKDLETQNVKMMKDGTVVQSLNIKNTQLQDIYNQCKDELNIKSQDIADLEKIVSNHINAIQKMNEEKVAREELMGQRNAEIEKLGNENTVFKSTLESLTREKMTLELSVKDGQSQISNLNEQMVTLQGSLNEKERALSSWHLEIKQIQDRHGAELDGKTKEILTLRRETAVAKEALSSIEEENQQITNKWKDSMRELVTAQDMLKDSQDLVKSTQENATSDKDRILVRERTVLDQFKLYKDTNERQNLITKRQLETLKKEKTSTISDLNKFNDDIREKDVQIKYLTENLARVNTELKIAKEHMSIGSDMNLGESHNQMIIERLKQERDNYGSLLIHERNEIGGLKSKVDVLERQKEELEVINKKLAGHQNLKQKIFHLQTVKDENHLLKEQNHELASKLRDLESKLMKVNI